MILNEVNFFSETLGFRSTMYILLPQRTLVETQKSSTPNYRTLYLLHGNTDDHTAWQRRSSIERYVEGLNLAVVMPFAQRSFYTDMVHGLSYGQFIGEEVPAIAREIFALSADRKDTFIAGLSMGGYGAFKLALTHPERYAAAASLSGVLDIVQAASPDNPRNNPERLVMFEQVFGDGAKLSGSKHDLFAIAAQAAASPLPPRLYQCCGTEDFLHADNIRFRDAVQKLPLDLTYEEGPGDHSWPYWDKMIQNVLAWMFPEGKKLEGLIGI